MECQLSDFKTYKMMLWKCCTQYASESGKLSSGHKTGKGQFNFHPKEKQYQRVFKLPHNWNISHASKVMLKFLQARPQQHVNQELPVQARFRKGKGTRDQIANIHWLIENARKFRKTCISASLTTPKSLTVWITTNCGKFLKRWEYQTTWPVSWEICMHVKKQQLELDMEQWTGSQLRKESVKSVYCLPAYLIYMQSISRKIPDWMKH